MNTCYPANATVTIHNSITSKVTIATAGNPASYTYQWYKNGTAVSGATSSSYTFTPTAVGTTTIYCKVTNAAGTVTSRTATITATAPYLFKDGVWSSSLAPNGVGYAGEAKIDSGDIYAQKNGVICTKDKIDFSKYNTITATIPSNYNCWFELSVLSTYTLSYVASPVAKKSTQNGQDSYSSVTFDVSGVSGNYYFQILCVSNYATGADGRYARLNDILFEP